MSPCPRCGHKAMHTRVEFDLEHLRVSVRHRCDNQACPRGVYWDEPAESVPAVLKMIERRFGIQGAVDSPICCDLNDDSDQHNMGCAQQEEDARKASDQEKVSPYIQGKEDCQYHMEQHDLCRFCICCKKGESA